MRAYPIILSFKVIFMTLNLTSLPPIEPSLGLYTLTPKYENLCYIRRMNILSVFVLFLCTFASLRLCVEFFGFAFSESHSLTFAAAVQHRGRGGQTGASRGAQRHQPGDHAAFCVISAPCSLVTARHFSGFCAVCESKTSPFQTTFYF